MTAALSAFPGAEPRVRESILWSVIGTVIVSLSLVLYLWQGFVPYRMAMFVMLIGQVVVAFATFRGLMDKRRAGPGEGHGLTATAWVFLVAWVLFSAFVQMCMLLYAWLVLWSISDNDQPLEGPILVPTVEKYPSYDALISDYLWLVFPLAILIPWSLFAAWTSSRPGTPWAQLSCRTALLWLIAAVPYVHVAVSILAKPGVVDPFVFK